MQTGTGHEPTRRRTQISILWSGSLFFSFIVLFAFAVSLSCAQTPKQNPQSLSHGHASPGFVWRVKGEWQADNQSAPLAVGDAIEPGALLQPSDLTASHSIIVLLPDGQRLFYECFTAADCARGFRVPPLYRRPEPFALDMTARIRAVLVRQRAASSPAGRREPELPRDETLAVIGDDHRVQAGGLASNLPNGHYTYNLQAIDPVSPRRFRLPLDKTAPTISLVLPNPGLYKVTVIDDQNTPRVDLFIAAIRPEQDDPLTNLFEKAKDQLAEWKEDDYGWPIHDLQRAYLESIVLGIQPSESRRDTGKAGTHAPAGNQAAKDRSGAADRTAEPRLSPQAGVFKEDTAVSLFCSTPGAEIHYTANGSQPLTSSPVYHAPIMVRGSELTIKAFAAVAGKKDSPVVTGTFRIAE